MTVAAPYRHFADREELLAAVAIHALTEFGAVLAAAKRSAESRGSAAAEPGTQFAAMARSYVRFAAEHRPLFDAIYGMAIDKNRFPEVHRAEEPVSEVFKTCVRAVCGDDAHAIEVLEGAVHATARGYAALLLDGEFDEEPDPVAAASGQAFRATLAMINGRAALA